MSDDDCDASVPGEWVDPLAGVPGEWLTIEKAAARLACSQRTIWRLIGDGTLRRRKVGRNAEVFVPDGMPTVGTPPSDMVPASPVTRDAVALAVIEELRARREQDTASIERLTDSTTRQAEEIGRLQAERDALRAQLAAAEAERDALKARPWWRRIMG